MGMGIKSAMEWEWDGNEMHGNGDYDVEVGKTVHTVTNKHLQQCLC